jgi:hypothetical protein
MKKEEYKMRKIGFLAILCLIFFLAGCMTIDSHYTGKRIAVEPDYYSEYYEEEEAVEENRYPYYSPFGYFFYPSLWWNGIYWWNPLLYYGYYNYYYNYYPYHWIPAYYRGVRSSPDVITKEQLKRRKIKSATKRGIRSRSSGSSGSRVRIGKSTVSKGGSSRVRVGTSSRGSSGSRTRKKK